MTSLFSTNEITQLQKAPDFESADQEYSQELLAYLTYYNMPLTATYTHGYISVEEERVSLLEISPDNPIGTLLLIHGYFDHGAILHEAVTWAFERKLVVLLPDLQGHGLSSGERASIYSFESYAQLVVRVCHIAKNRHYLPLHVMGHSTGATPLLDLILTKRKCWNGKTITIAPLVRSDLWHLSKVGSFLFKSFLKKCPRIFKASTHDKKLQKFLKNEPLCCPHLSTQWSTALFAWNKKAELFMQSDEEIIVLQGTADHTVDWRYNCKYIQKHLPSALFHYIEKADHHLLKEIGPYRQKVYDFLDKHFSSKDLGTTKT